MNADRVGARGTVHEHGQRSAFNQCFLEALSGVFVADALAIEQDSKSGAVERLPAPKTTRIDARKARQKAIIEQKAIDAARQAGQKRNNNPAVPRQEPAAKTPAGQAASSPRLPARDPNACTESGDDLAPAMVVIPPGHFRMGSPDSEAGRTQDEGPVHWVSLRRPFAISQCEVTVAQFRRFVTDAGYVTQAERSGGCYVWDEVKKKVKQEAAASWRDPGFVQSEDHPVVCVAWDDAKAYIDWLSQRTGARYRLPTEAEWEYAARAGTDTSRYWGDDPDQGCSYANGADRTARGVLPNRTLMECEDGYVDTAPIANYSPNGFHLYDMLGNVWEWTVDCWHENYQEAPDDGTPWLEAAGGDCNLRVVRGGSWSNVPQILRSANRVRYWTDEAFSYQGFRLGRDF